MVFNLVLEKVSRDHHDGGSGFNLPRDETKLRLSTITMATLIFQRATWSLQISRTSRAFTVSFTTALPRKQKPRHLTPDAYSSGRSSRQDASRRHTRDTSAHTAFTSTKVYQAQKAHYATNTPAQSRSSYNSTVTAPPTSAPQPSKPSTSPETSDLASGLSDQPIILDEGARQVDWTRSFHGLSDKAFSKEAADILLAPIESDDIEVKPDGILYLPEIKYRRILNRAFGPGAWGLAPRGETIVTAKAVTREYALVAMGR